jgi:hypothetical protein
MEMSMFSLKDFFRYKRGSEILFADGNGIHCRLGLCIRTIWMAEKGCIVPRPSKNEFVFCTCQSWQDEFGVAYIVSPTREINPEIPGVVMVTDYLQIGGVFYYTIIYEKNNRPRSLEKRNWTE